VARQRQGRQVDAHHRLDRLDTTSQIRALRWLNDRYDPPIGVAGDMYPQPPANPNT
jgi:hypothetical protein